ncbi:Alpha/beta hydrolase domain-containing protein 13 [Apophysomyces sp. BC1034]|nr:Alpha/beta hydrolase domain-containing protein 13 [Apophysomyces sp. BC1021]KAG0187423.1 Alpha/beta hydrolase domain-containing protein 13 [Apophysomyces sp. BC1034]
MMIAFQNKLIYLGYIPYGSRHETYERDRSFPLEVREQIVWTEDRKKLHGFVVNQPGVKQGPVMVYFQGNAGNMIHRLGLFKTMVDAIPDLTVVGICYRGFGSSLGRASEKGLQKDAKAILSFVHQQYPARPIYVYGHSLGGSVAVDICQHVQVQGLILENTYTSIQDMVQAIYPRHTPYPLIAKAFLWNHWKSQDKIPKVQAPILFLSADKDEIVPSAQMHKLYAAASSSSYRKFVNFPKAMHMDTFTKEPVAFKKALRDFISETS